MSRVGWPVLSLLGIRENNMNYDDLPVTIIILIVMVVPIFIGWYI